MDIFTNLLIIQVLDNVGTALTLIIMGPYIIKSGGSPIAFGVCTSVSSLISFLWMPIAGGLSDSIGRRTVLFICMMIGVLGDGVIAFTSGLYLIYIGQILKSVGTPAISILKAILDDNSKSKEEAVENFTKMQGPFRTCFFVALVSGEILSEYSLPLLFLLATIVHLINIVLAFYTIPDSKPKSKTTTPIEFKWSTIVQEISKAFTKNIRDLERGQNWDLFIINICLFGAYMTFFPNLGIFLMETHGKSFQTVSYVVAFMGIVSAITGALMSKIKALYKNDTTGYKRVLHMSVLQMTAMLSIGLTSSFEIFLTALLPLAIGRCILETTLNEMLLKRTTDKDKGGVMGAFDSTVSFANIIAPLIGGVSTQVLGAQWTAVVAAIPFTAGIIIERFKRIKTR